MRALVLQHVAVEHPGALTNFAAARGDALEIVLLERGDPIPDPLGYHALIVLGGPMNVDEEHLYPWLAVEKATIARAVQAGLPVFGICLGAQLLARALGAPVTRSPVPEIGFDTVRLEAAAEADPLFHGLGPELRVFQGHGDMFAIPDGAVRLATGPACPNQAFRYGASAYGLQFHVEVTAEQLEEWLSVPENCAEVAELLGADGPRRLRADAARYGSALRALGQTLYDRLRALAEARAGARTQA